MNDAGVNGFTGTIPSEIGLLTGLNYLSFGKWNYIVDHFDCLKMFLFCQQYFEYL